MLGSQLCALTLILYVSMYGVLEAVGRKVGVGRIVDIVCSGEVVIGRFLKSGCVE